MEQSNQTIVDYFIIQGISDDPELRILSFIIILLIYLLILGNNGTILLLVCLDHHLQTPMYFFLANLAILDMISPTIALHNVIFMFITGDNTILYARCISQTYIFTLLVCDEQQLLTAMSYDRYIAICNPLQYHMIMNRRLCIQMDIVCWLLGALEMMPYIILLTGFTCYTSNIINHFFCDLVPLIALSCSDTSVIEILSMTEGLFLITLTPFILTFISYVFIIASILRIRSNTGRQKALYTCYSHLTVVTLLYTTLLTQYLVPTSQNTAKVNKFISLLNTALLPLLNPLIYSLKNKDVKSAMKRRLGLLKNNL